MNKLIVGLGNPGRQYAGTRHNLGFLVLEALCARHKISLRNSASNLGMLTKAVIEDVECSLLMPMTFMNNSGLSVKKLMDRQGIALEDVLIVCDDFSLSFGKLRLRPSGSAGGHNGLKSIIANLGSNQFARLRMGIDVPPNADDVVEYVLTNFTPVQIKALPDFINHALDCVTCWVTEGAQVAMNRFN
ncbi:MAG: aminoacyl-tRNA hydrolase [Candidatus Omnitrophica bacterium]|nr:aminoacyl-tRNA hydrolase [Candidatus Omnitrophota bacterium]